MELKIMAAATAAVVATGINAAPKKPAAATK